MWQPDRIRVLEEGMLGPAAAMLACQSQHNFFVLTEMLLQLCKEHGINKDGILEDFATQVKMPYLR